MLLRRALVVLVLGAALLLALGSASSPSPLGLSAPPAEFSAARAMAHLDVVARAPHPAGTAADDAVRAYLVQQLEGLGWAVEIQDATSLTELYARKWQIPVVAAHVRNVIARRKGTSGGPALALMAHYDSRELAPGASDDGYGVATLLETARALGAGPPLRHDLMLVLTDGEEVGLLGARVFFGESPAAREVGLVLNFEARGDRGPVTMFQTSAGASGLLDVLARAAPDVVASSITQEAYRRMPNDTDLTVALEAGKPGMNFANIDGFEHYHQASDTVANASAATLQHHGSYALSLARAFGDAEPMVPAKGGERVYFRLGPAFVRYPARLALPFAIAAAAALLLGLGRAIRRKTMTARGVGASTLVAVLAVVAAVVVALGAGWGLGRLRGEVLAVEELRAAVKAVYALALAALGAAVAWGALAAARRRSPAEIAAGGAIVSATFALVTAAVLPGGSYVFLWPLAPAVAMAFAPAGPLHPVRLALSLGSAALAVVILVPLGQQLSVAFGPAVAPGIAAISALGVLISAPLLGAVGPARRAVGPLAVAAAGLACVVAVLVMPPFDASAPRPDSLVYAVDGDGDATWISLDDTPDAWTAAALSAAKPSRLTDLLPRYTRKLLRGAAPDAASAFAARARVDLLSDTHDGAARSVRLRVTPPPGAEIVSLTVPPEAHVVAASVLGRAFGVEADGWLDLLYFGPPPGGLEVSLSTIGAADDAIPVSVLVQLRGLPAEVLGALGPRPPGTMPEVSRGALRSSDMTLVKTTVRE